MEGYESASDELSFIDIELNSSEISTEYVYKDIESGHIGKKDYLYSRELKKIEEWIGRYRETNVGRNYQKDNSGFPRKVDFLQNTNNIFSVYGNRGSGKSSFIQTVRYKVQNDTENNGSFGGKNIHVLPLIDPSIFDGRIDIIELFVSMLKSEVKKIKKNSREQSNFGHFEDQVFLEKTTKIIDVLKMLRLESSVFAEKKTRIEALENISNQQNFFKLIEELIDSFLHKINTHYNDKNYDTILLTIDDLDLVPNKYTYSMLQSIFKYLNRQKRLCILIGYRREQLLQSVEDNLIKENESLLTSNVISMNSIREQAMNLINKGLPLAQSVELKLDKFSLIYPILMPFIKNKEADIESLKSHYGTDCTVNEFFDKVIRELTRLSFIPSDKSEQIRFIIPENLRDILQFLEYLHGMENISNKYRRKQEPFSIIEGYKRNLNTLKSYLVQRFSNILPEDLNEILLELDNKNNQTKNSYICHMISKQIIPAYNEILDDDSYEYIQDQASYLRAMKPYNVSLGDVFSMIEAYKIYALGSDYQMYFVYGLKMHYSIELLKSVFDMLLHNINENKSLKNTALEQYMAIARGKMIPDGYRYNIGFAVGTTKIRFDPAYSYFAEIITYSDVAAQSDIRRRINNKIVFNFSYVNQGLEYRHLYFKDNYIKNRNYFFDTYSKLFDRYYIERAIDLIVNKKENPYLFTSMFDYDVFTQQNYEKRNQSLEVITSIFKSVNEVMELNSSKTDTISELDQLQLSKEIFPANFNEDKPYSPLYSEFELDILNIIAQLITEDKNFSNKVLLREQAEKVINSRLKEKRDFAKLFFDVYREWPEKIKDLELSSRYSLFIQSKSSRSFPELDDTLGFLVDFVKEDITVRQHSSKPDSNIEKLNEVAHEVYRTPDNYLEGVNFLNEYNKHRENRELNSIEDIMEVVSSVLQEDNESHLYNEISEIMERREN